MVKPKVFVVTYRTNDINREPGDEWDDGGLAYRAAIPSSETGAMCSVPIKFGRRQDAENACRLLNRFDYSDTNSDSEILDVIRRGTGLKRGSEIRKLIVSECCAW